MRRPRFLCSLLLLCALLAAGAMPPAPVRAAEVCFAETGFCVQGRFLEYWQANGGLARNGFPLTNERVELLEDGNKYTVQYFERVRLELHPENAPPYDVLLGRFGPRARARDYWTSYREPTGAVEYTLDAISPRFLAYWRANGGLAQFGYPIGPEIGGQWRDGRRVDVQYFERAAMEYHPEYAGTPHEILLAPLGRVVLAQVEQLGVVPAFLALYTTQVSLRVALGPPLEPPDGAAYRIPGATQPFEGGRMFFKQYPPAAPGGRVDKFIDALCGRPDSGRTYPFFDTWVPGEPAGGGPGPGPGLYEPRLGFYKVWSTDPAVRACLGHATAPDGEALTLTLQNFRRGQLMLVEGAEGRFVYALTYNTFTNGSPAPGTEQYQRFPDLAR